MSAVPNNVRPFKDQITLDELVDQYIRAKRVEDNASKERVKLEEQILAFAPAKEEGATTTELSSGMKLTTTGKLGYVVDDLDALREITRQWDANLVPLKTTTALDITGCKFLRSNRPDLWEQVAKVITIKPAKTAVKVSV